MNVNIWIICPFTAKLPEILVRQQLYLMAEAILSSKKEKGWDFQERFETWNPPGDPPTTHLEREKRIALVRNHAIEDIKREVAAGVSPPTHIIWMDADISFYKEDLFTKLVSASIDNLAVTAPMVFLDHRSFKCPPGRFYDTAGFVNQEIRTGLWRPWFAGSGFGPELPELFELDGSVGCLYCVPWKVYEKGALHEPTNGRFTEHYSVCQTARRFGYKLLVLTKEIALHAYLPDFGIEFH